jgi:tetratricopeptide (TPR) repeat protein
MTSIATIARKLPFLLLFFILFVGTEVASGQWIEKRDLVGLYVDGEPFDLLYLNEDGENAILKIAPLAKPPKNPLPDRGELVFAFPIDTDEKFEVPYTSIEKYTSFNKLLIAEADVWMKEKKFPEAFRNLFHVYNRGGKKDPAMVDALMSCLFLDGKENYDSGEFELALSIYEDIYQNDPNFKVDGFNIPLADIVMACHNGMIKKRFEKEDYIGVRQSLASVVAQYGEKASKLEKDWSANFEKRSDKLVAQARKFASAGRGREAHLAANQAEQMSPGRDIVEQLKQDLLIKFPMIIIGVSQDAADADPNRFEHWGSRRVGRLTQRTIVENTGLTDEGGKFEFLNGTFYPADEIGLEYTMEINQEPNGFAVPDINAYQFSSRIRALADQDSPSHKTAWAKILKSVEIEDQNRVTFTLRTPFVRPEALLKIPYTDPGPDGQPDQNGFYVMTAEEKRLKTFEVNPRYPRLPDRQHPVIVEQLFSDASVAADQLIAGNINVVDRVPIADLKRLKATPNIKVRSYILPTVHMLVPKIRSEVAKDPNFRNGLSHAIDRNLLVNDVICGGEEVDGCDVISGPFPIGTEENDQIAYAYDMKVRPLAFNSQMGAVMVNLSLRPQPPVRPDAIPSPKLVIAHTNSTTATDAAAAIARMWTEIGIETSTRELAAGKSVPDDDEWDFLYVATTMEEPLIDAASIIGPDGFAKNVSAPIEQTLRNLSYSQSWQAACSDLRRLHRQTSIDLSVIPLWQVKEHYAYRTTVREIGRDLIHLYQNVDRWRIDLTAEEVQQEK